MLKNACSSTFPLANRTAKANQSPLDKYSIQRIIFYSQFFKAQWQIMIYTFRCYELFQVAWRSHSPDEAKSKFSERPRFLEELNVIKLPSLVWMILDGIPNPLV